MSAPTTMFTTQSTSALRAGPARSRATVRAPTRASSRNPRVTSRDGARSRRATTTTTTFIANGKTDVKKLFPVRSQTKPRATTAQAAAVQASKIRIRLRSFETNHMHNACDKIIEAAKSTEARISGPVPLPTKRRIFCVLRSPHVNKDSREHFETRTHHRLIDVHNPTAQTIDALMGLELPSGVDVEIKL